LIVEVKSMILISRVANDRDYHVSDVSKEI